MNKETNIWKLVARHLSNEATEDENNNLKKIMEEDPYLQFSMEVLTDFWKDKNNNIPDKEQQ